MSDFFYPCDGKHEGAIANYHPLTYDEIVSLLHRAQGAPWQVRNDIQIRLTQAIPGQTCPYPWGNTVGAIMVQVDDLYRRFLRVPASDVSGIARQLSALLNAAEPPPEVPARGCC